MTMHVHMPCIPDIQFRMLHVLSMLLHVLQIRLIDVCERNSVHDKGAISGG